MRKVRAARNLLRNSHAKDGVYTGAAQRKGRTRLTGTSATGRVR